MKPKEKPIEGTEVTSGGGAERRRAVRSVRNGREEKPTNWLHKINVRGRDGDETIYPSAIIDNQNTIYIKFKQK